MTAWPDCDRCPHNAGAHDPRGRCLARVPLQVVAGTKSCPCPGFVVREAPDDGEPLEVTDLGRTVVEANRLGVLSRESFNDPELADGLTYQGDGMFGAQVRTYDFLPDDATEGGPGETVLAIFIADPSGSGAAVRWSGDAMPVVEVSVEHARKLRDLLVAATIRGAL